MWAARMNAYAHGKSRQLFYISVEAFVISLTISKSNTEDHFVNETLPIRWQQQLCLDLPAVSPPKPSSNHPHVAHLISLQLTRPPLQSSQLPQPNSESDFHLLQQHSSNLSILSQWQAPEIAHMTHTFPLSQRLAELALNPHQAIKERRRYKQ